MSDKSFKITVTFESRPDGGLRVWSEDVPGLVLSHPDINGVLADVPQAIKTILSHHLGGEIEVSPLENLREALESRGIVSPPPSIPGTRDYVAYHN